MTPPWISSTVPTFWPSREPFSRSSRSSSDFSCWRSSVVACSTWSPPLAEPLGARNDFHDLLGDVGLTLTVGLEREVVDQLGRVLRRVPHRGHARAVL